jgi:hypothetical protein
MTCLKSNAVRCGAKNGLPWKKFFPREEKRKQSCSNPLSLLAQYGLDLPKMKKKSDKKIFDSLQKKVRKYGWTYGLIDASFESEMLIL